MVFCPSWDSCFASFRSSFRCSLNSTIRLSNVGNRTISNQISPFLRENFGQTSWHGVPIRSKIRGCASAPTAPMEPRPPMGRGSGASNPSLWLTVGCLGTSGSRDLSKLDPVDGPGADAKHLSRLEDARPGRQLRPDTLDDIGADRPAQALHFARARARPAWTRLRIIDRSNSANAPVIW